MRNQPLPHRVGARVRFYVAKVCCNATVRTRSGVKSGNICPTVMLLALTLVATTANRIRRSLQLGVTVIIQHRQKINKNVIVPGVNLNIYN